MSAETERLEAELNLAKLSEKLEAAREAMHSALTPKTLAAYRAASEKVVEARRDWRENHRITPEDPGAGVAQPKTVKGKAGVHNQ